jgi:peptidyl-prolyl cis-trans isomerase SurA
MYADLIEKIYAVVESEVITYTEYMNKAQAETNRLSSLFKGEELVKKIDEMKKQLLDIMINDKVLLAEAKSRNYQVDGDVTTMLNRIKEQYGFENDERLKVEVEKQGITWEDFVKFQKNRRMIERLQYEEIGPKVEKNVDTSKIMEYYKNHKKEFMIEKKVVLNAIFLKKGLYLTESILKEKQEIIIKELKGKDFVKVAEEYTDSESKDKILLGDFKVSELDENMLRVANGLKKGEYSDEWIATDLGYYLIQLQEMIPANVKEYKNVRAAIKLKLRDKESRVLMAEYIKELRKKSYIKIYK